MQKRNIKVNREMKTMKQKAWIIIRSGNYTL